jgi:hypothetical protein
MRGEAMTQAVVGVDVMRRLNHVEFVHRPGEQKIVAALFELLGFETFEVWDGQIVIVVLDSASYDRTGNHNYLAGSEVRPEQWAFDQALAEAFQSQPLDPLFRNFLNFIAEKPHLGMHFGVHLSSPEQWEETIARLEDTDNYAPPLRGRVELLRAFRRGDPGAPSNLHQAFIWTDVIASGSLALGQRIELATSLP